jgi:hypothetical protein
MSSNIEYLAQYSVKQFQLRGIMSKKILSRLLAVSLLVASVFTALLGAKGFKLFGSSHRNNELDKILKDQLGESFKTKPIQDIYLAGPNKTIICT